MLHIEKPGRLFIDVMLKTIFVCDSMSRNVGCDCIDTEVSMDVCYVHTEAH
jgi:hypothetical protein